MTAASERQPEFTGPTGDPGAAARSPTDELLPLVYEELRRLAERHLAQERVGHTLQPTALAHEAYLRLVGGGSATWESRRHFLGAAARAIRRILVDHARAKGREKRGGGVLVVPLTEEQAPSIPPPPIDLLALDEALEQLAVLDPLKATLVEIRFFGGLTVAEAAAALGISEGAAGREWQFARLWLCGQLDSACNRAEGDAR